MTKSPGSKISFLRDGADGGNFLSQGARRSEFLRARCEAVFDVYSHDSQFEQGANGRRDLRRRPAVPTLYVNANRRRDDTADARAGFQQITRADLFAVGISERPRHSRARCGYRRRTGLLEKPRARRIPGVDQHEHFITRMQQMKCLGSLSLYGSSHRFSLLRFHRRRPQDWPTNALPHKRARVATRLRSSSTPWLKPCSSCCSWWTAPGAAPNRQMARRRFPRAPASQCNWPTNRRSPE